MAFENTDNDNKTAPERAPTYGDTVVQGHASAVLRNYSQDINVHGDVHFHVHESFGSLNVSEALVQLSQSSSILLTLGRDIASASELDNKVAQDLSR